MNSLIYPAAAVVGFIAYKSYKVFEVSKDISYIPGISLLSLLVSYVSDQSFEEQFEQLYKPVLSKYGYARLWMRGNWDIIITDPKHVREVLGNAEVFTKRPEGGDKFAKKMLVSRFFGASNIATSDGEDWRRHRRIANPAFKKNWSNKMFGDCAIELIEKIDGTNQAPTIIHTLFQHLALDVLGQGMFSYDFEAVKKGEASHYLSVFNEVLSALFSPAYFLFPILEDWIPSRKYYHNKNAELRAFLLKIIKKRQIELKKGIDKQDLLSLMIKASWDATDENARLTDEEVLNDLSVFFLVGHDTTANTLTSIFYYLAKNPEIQEKARLEVLNVLGSNNLVITPSTEQLKMMPYILCIIKESMRIITTVLQIRRYCNTTTTLSGGLTIPAKNFVLVHSWAVHHNSETFPEPENFNPDRFLNAHDAQNQAWMPFGFGTRMCLGYNFSLIQQQVVMVMLLQKYKVGLGPNSMRHAKPFIKSIGLAHLIDMDVCFIPRF